MTGSPHPIDDDLNDAGDLPPEVAANVAHAPPPSDDPHLIRYKVLEAHLDGLIAKLGDTMRQARAAREALGDS
jgi:hypothetical protein